MKVQEFIDKIKSDENFDIYKELEIREYLPIELKKTIAKMVIFESTDDSNGVIIVDSLQKYLSFIKYMITYHTNLEYNGNDDYDLMSSTIYKGESVLDVVLGLFEKDNMGCTYVLDFMMSDLLQHNTIEHSIVRLLDTVNINSGQLLKMLKDKLGEVDLKTALPEGLDAGQIMSLFVENDEG